MHQALKLGERFANKLLYNSTNPNTLFSDPELTKPNFTNAQELKSIINNAEGGNSSNKPSFISGLKSKVPSKLEYKFKIPMPDFEQFFPADFHAQYGNLMSITSDSQFALNGDVNLELTMGFYLKKPTLATDTTSVAGIIGSERLVIGSDAIHEGILGNDAQFTIVVPEGGSVPAGNYIVSISKTASNSNEKIMDIIDYLNGSATGLGNAKGGTGSVNLLGYGFSTGIEDGKLVIKSNQTAFSIKTESVVRPSEFENGNKALGFNRDCY